MGVTITPNRNAPREMEAFSNEHMQSFMELFSEEVKQRSPFDTGHNKDSIAIGNNGKGSFDLHTETGYGGWLEIGTSRVPARPYFAPGFVAAQSTFNSTDWNG